MAKRASLRGEVHGHEYSPVHPLERLIFFSDAVFAIAITLLIIEVHPPRLGFHASDRDHLVSLINLIPSFVAFFISFFVMALSGQGITARSASRGTGRLGWSCQTR
jgi:hypothetical protein